MMPIVKKSSQLDISNLRACSTVELKAELANALKLTAHHLTYLAAIWGELEKRGEDLSALKTGIGKYLALIASGSLLAEAVVAFAGEPMLLRRVSMLPLAEQKKAIENGSVPSLRPRVETVSREIPASGTMRRGPAPHEMPSCKEPAIDVQKMASAGTPKDVAEMCLKMIEASIDPKDVAQRLIPELERIAKRKKSVI